MHTRHKTPIAHHKTVLASALLSLASGAATAQPILEEVIVTAQKRAENVLDVPISISVFNSDMVEQLSARTLTDIGSFTAGVQMNNDNALQPTYTVRGIETNDWTVGSDPAVAVYVDGVYAARGAGAEAALADINRVEILKGPQGTLFGRNATGGAIHIVSQPPVFENEGRVKVTLGDYERRDVEAMYNYAISDDVALRGVFVSRQRDGYFKQIDGPDLNDQDQQNLRLSLLWDASEDTSVLWRMDYSELDQAGAAQYTMVADVFERANPGYEHELYGDVNHDGESLEEREMFSTSVEINHDMENVTFTSITGYREFETELVEDLDGSNNPDYLFHSSNPDDNDYFSQEFRFVGETANLKWTAGAGYSRENVEHTTTAIFSYSTLETFAWAEILRSPTSGVNEQFLNLIAGLPLDEIADLATLNDLEVGEVLGSFRDEQRAAGTDGIAGASFVWSFLNDRGQLGDFGVPTDAFVGIPYILNDWGPNVAAGAPWVEEYSSEGTFESYAIYGDATWSINEKMNLTGGLRYTYDDKDFEVFSQYQNQIVGANFGLAFFNNGQALVESDQSESWDALSGRLVLDYLPTDDIMVYGSIATGFKSGGFNSLSFGPGIETSYDQEEVINYELGMKGTFMDNLQITTAVFFYEYDNLQELDLIGSPIPSYNLRNADAEGYGGEIEWIWLATENLRLTGNYSYLETEYTSFDIIPAAGETEEDNFEGEPVVGNPEHKVNLGIEYTAQLGDFGSLVARANYSWTDEFRESLSNETQTVDAFDITHVRVHLLPNDGNWEVSLWSTNVFDEEAITIYGDNGNAIGSQTAWHIPPRMYGADFLYYFQ